MKYIKKYEQYEQYAEFDELFWKIETKYNKKTLETALLKIDPSCLEYFRKVNYIDGMLELKFIWIYLNPRRGYWNYDNVSEVKDPIKRYHQNNLRYMGEVIINEDDINYWKRYDDVKKYNL